MEDFLLDFTTDPGEFLASAGEWLARDPVVSTVVTTIAHRAVADLAAGVPQPEEHWWLTVRDRHGTVVGAVMRTATFGARPPFVLPLPDGVPARLARALHDRGEALGAANGALPSVLDLAEEAARLDGGLVRVAQHTRLFELADLVEPPPASGSLRAATLRDAELCQAWFAAFMADADVQAGRSPGSSAHEVPTAEEMVRRIERGTIWLWEDDGVPVHLTAANPPAYGVSRIGPVFTPKEQRGHGYASCAVHAVSRALQERGVRVCLFTDQANPTSNAIYRRLGFRPVVDMANLVIESGP